MIRFPKIFFVFVFLLALLQGGINEYKLTIWGVSCGSVQWDSPKAGEINFTTNSTGLVDLVWSFKNKYTTVFDSTTYRILSASKSIDQVNIKQSLSSTWEPGLNSYVYDTGDIISAPKQRLNIFTVMEMASALSPDTLDTRKMPMILEGEFFQVRLVHAGNESLEFNRKTFDTDHYRIDFFREKGGRKILDQTDFFHEYLVHPQAVKQLWVSRGNDRKIVQAAVTLNGITIYGRLVE